jgi:hypothetical protein
MLEIFDGNLNTNPNARRIGYFKNGFAPPAQLPAEIDLSSQSSGTYYIRMWYQNKVLGTTKIIKK